MKADRIAKAAIAWDAAFRAVLEARKRVEPCDEHGWEQGCVNRFDAINLLTLGSYDLGRYGFTLSHPQAYEEPIPARGALGLWNWQRAEVARV